MTVSDGRPGPTGGSDGRRSECAAASPTGADGSDGTQPDHGEHSYVGHGCLEGKKTIITGGDSGIGRAAAIVFAREGADVLIAYLEEDEDAAETARWVEREGRQAPLVRGDLADSAHCRQVIDQAVDAFGQIDVLINNAAVQRTYAELEQIQDEEWDRHFDTNIGAIFRLCKAALPHMQAGASIINTASVNVDQPKPSLLPYATAKGAIANFTAGPAQQLAERGIRVNSVLPGPVWTPLIPSTMPPDKVAEFGTVPMGRPGQPAELAPIYVLLASDEASYMSGGAYPVTDGNPAGALPDVRRRDLGARWPAVAS
jgi:NAD(P)-dependent dehydrogenase (short-subunit alcohol dehydrogenase family)